MASIGDMTGGGWAKGTRQPEITTRAINSCCDGCRSGNHLYDCPVRIDGLEAEVERLRADLDRCEVLRHRVEGRKADQDREIERLRLAVKRIYRDRRESDKVYAECAVVIPLDELEGFR